MSPERKTARVYKTVYHREARESELEYGAEWWWARACEESIWGKEKKHPKGLKGTVARDHTGWGIVPGFNS